MEGYLRRIIELVLLFALSLGLASAKTLISSGERATIIGDIFTISAESGDSLASLGERYGIGIEEMRKANISLKSKRLSSGTHVVIPSAFVLPDAPRQGIVINLPEMRLYYFVPHSNTVMTFPIGVGRAGWATPTAETQIIEKKEYPIWYVPVSIQDHMAERGVELPDVVSPGPDNPLGRHALRLALRGYLIHGTNRPETVGKRSSSGCIRMLPKDAQELFEMVTVGTLVRIVNQPYKAGWYKGELYLEAHQPFYDHNDENYVTMANARQVVRDATTGHSVSIDWALVDRVAREQLGFPRFISR